MQPQLPNDFIEEVIKLDGRLTKAELSLVNDALPIGGLIEWPLATTFLPSNWLPAQGQLVDRVTYGSLFAVYGTTFGAGDGSTTFQLPNYDSVNKSPVWNNVTVFGGAWGNNGGGYQTAQYWKDPFGMVHLRGLILRTGTYVLNEAVLNLPVGYRPASIELFNVVGNQIIQRIDVSTNGDVITAGVVPWVGTSAGSAWYLSLSGITYDSGSLPTVAATSPPYIAIKAA